MEFIEIEHTLEKGQSMTGLIAKMMKLSFMEKALETLARDRLEKCPCVVHFKPTTIKAIDHESGTAFEVMSCCKKQRKQVTRYLNHLRSDLFKISVLMIVAHQKIGCDKFADLCEQAEKIPLESIEQFYNNMMELIIETGLKEIIDPGFKRDIEGIMKKAQVH